MTMEATEGGPVDLFGLVGQVLDRKFKVERLVAEGGFGVVYQGTHLTLEKPIAIKVLKTPAEFNEKARAQFIEKFALEGKTMARISHPNIVQVLDFGASAMPSGDLAPWMVLEWLTGQTLEALMLSQRGRHRFSPSEVLAIMKPVLEALAYAHDEGVAHRDIKPANMMVVQTKRGSTVRLMDFGIAKLMEEGESAGSGATRTRTTMNAFSPQYAAPEQISGTRTGPWTDVHALALIIVEMLTDRPPYDGDDMTQLFGQILSPVRPTPMQRGVDVGPWEPVIARALTMKPDERFKNAGEFLQALEATLPTGQHVGSATGAFRAIQDGQPPGMPVPPGVAPIGTSPTTLRGSAMSTDVHPPMNKSRMPVLIGVVAVVALAAGGITIALTRGSGNNTPATNVTAASTASPLATHTSSPPGSTPTSPPPTASAANPGNAPTPSPTAAMPAVAAPTVGAANPPTGPAQTANVAPSPAPSGTAANTVAAVAPAENHSMHPAAGHPVTGRGPQHPAAHANTHSATHHPTIELE